MSQTGQLGLFAPQTAPPAERKPTYTFAPRKVQRESREAYAKVKETAEAVRGKVYAWFLLHPEGATADELCAAWGCSANHTAPRLTELLKAGKLVRTGERRKTRAGCSAAVLRVA